MFSIKKILKDSYEFYLSKFVTILGATTVVYFAAVFFEEGADEMFAYTMIGGIFLSVLFGVIGVIIEIGYVKYLLKLVSGGYPDIKDLLKYSYLFWRYILGVMLLALVVAGGTILLIVPGIYLALRFMFVPLLILDKEVTIKQAFKKSTVLTEGSKWKLLGLVLSMALIQILFSMAFLYHSGPVLSGISTVLVSPFFVITLIKTYRSLQGLK